MDWINSADRLPPDGVLVLVWMPGAVCRTGDPPVHLARYFEAVGGWQLATISTNGFFVVRHWMPLPNQPDGASLAAGVMPWT